MPKIKAGDTLVIIAPFDASRTSVDAVLNSSRKAHNGPVIVLPKGYKAMSGGELRKALDDAEALHTSGTGSPGDTQDMGTTKPPPPPPPPG